MKTPNYKCGYRGKLMRLMLTSGGVSYRTLDLMSGERLMYVRKLRSMNEEGIVRVNRVGKYYVGVLDSFDDKSEEYMDYYPGYRGNYIRYGRDRASDSGKYRGKGNRSKAVKAFRHMEVVTMMEGGEINVYPDEKPMLYFENSTIPQGAYFYSDTEVKTVSGFAPKIKDKENGNDSITVTSRAQGILTSDGGDYIVYHTDNQRLTWASSQEYQMQYCTARLLGLKCETKHRMEEISNCIILGTDTDVFNDMLNSPISTNKSGALLNVNNGYKNTYVIPISAEGKSFLNFMTRLDWQNQLREFYLSDKKINTTSSSSVYDAADKGERILLFCNANITRLNKFLLGTDFGDDSIEYSVYCFDYQKDFVIKAVDGRARVLSTPYEDFAISMNLPYVKKAKG